jgi:hypothetical protein
MAENVRQKVVSVDNNAGLVALLNGYLLQGFVIHQMINLAPFANKILIVYYDPSVDPSPVNP